MDGSNGHGSYQYTNPAGATDSGESRFSLLEKTLEEFQENARYMGVIASDFNSRSQEPLNQKVHTLISGLQQLDAMKYQFADVKIPLELLATLDEGKNPQLYTKSLLEKTLQKNKLVNGKCEIYNKFFGTLLKELSDEMPDDAAKYMQIRGIDREGNS